MTIPRRTVAGIALVLMMGACATAPPCPAPAKSATQVDLYFGRDIGGRAEVSEAQWTRFVDEEVTPRFPAGLTVTDARGQYRDTQTGKIDRERSKRLTVLVDDLAASRPKFEAIATAYKQRFKQQSVLKIEAPICAAF
ncbi:DUF3574 domain-containing protein [Reyranella sp. CPCC 100927]|uniref:DUF3574 domain-containing protein n=1 Tax=Reyranella sp. CPCC 100927 TaxID=2599616 RepID=UPI0011B442DF|nr:DUF3574 domain-containing protein [Reyranella sp. CPCC 100927]TWT09446.1 DUF3574 domain-containing protein [Reyranella sp. CPCC 100927]